MLTTGTPTRQQHYDAALRYAGTGSMLTGLAGSELHGSTRLPPTNQVHVLVPGARKRASKEFVEIERTWRLPTPLQRGGFPVAPQVRALLDAARRFTRHDPIRALLTEALQRGQVSVADLTLELEAGSGRGTSLCREVLDEMRVNVHSPAESWAYQLVRDSGLPPLWWNVRLVGADGTFLGKPDGWIDEVGLAWEIDSREFHLSPAEYDETVRRHSRMTAAGLVVVHTVPSRIRTEPHAVLEELRGAYHFARQRPRPPVTATRGPLRAG